MQGLSIQDFERSMLDTDRGLVVIPPFLSNEFGEKNEEEEVHEEMSHK
jgi:hypothetical protein